MYDNQYEEYIRSVLGYPSTANMNQNQMYQNEYPNPSQINMRNDLEEFYPEIYKIIYPMVQKSVMEIWEQIAGKRLNKWLMKFIQQ